LRHVVFAGLPSIDSDIAIGASAMITDRNRACCQPVGERRSRGRPDRPRRADLSARGFSVMFGREVGRTRLARRRCLELHENGQVRGRTLFAGRCLPAGCTSLTWAPCLVPGSCVRHRELGLAAVSTTTIESGWSCMTLLDPAGYEIFRTRTAAFSRISL
jgi:hypothetical protein